MSAYVHSEVVLPALKTKNVEKVLYNRMTYISLQAKRRTTIRTMIVAIGRASRFSPNSVDRDSAILYSVAKALIQLGYDVTTKSEEDEVLPRGEQVYLSMGRYARTLQHLAKEEADGAVVINTSACVALCCHRQRLFDVLRDGGVPVPSSEGDDGYWLKRGDGCAEAAGDVRYAADKQSMVATKKAMEDEGIRDIVVQAHVKGDLVKFYGVRGTEFFSLFYPGDDGLTKFGDESRNGKPHHYLFNPAALRGEVEKAASIAGIDVYGGDGIVRADGTFCLIDLNDWPSFSRCREDAAAAIAQLAVARLKEQAVLQDCLD